MINRQGSITALLKQNGQVSERYSYDAWGRRRNPANWNDYNVKDPRLISRGYTGHEHLDGFGLINMNGRMYDPVIGRILSPDAFVSSPTSTQSYNRYSYCRNNPLRYVAPSGYTEKPWDWEMENYVNYAGFDLGFRGPMGNRGFGANHYYGFDQGGGWDNPEMTPYAPSSAYTLIKGSNGNVWVNNKDLTVYKPVYGVATINGYFNRYYVKGWEEVKPIAKSTPQGQGDSGSGKTAQKIAMATNFADIAISTAEQTIQNTRAGSNFAYAISGSSKTVSIISNTIKYAPYVGLFVTVGTGSYLSVQKDPATGRPYQTWTETGTDIGANIATIFIGAKYGGWYGAGAAVLYLGLKYSADIPYEYYLPNGEINPGMQFIINKE